MERRNFLSLLAVSGSMQLFGSSALKLRDIAKYEEEFKIIQSLQEFIFPSSKEYLGARDFDSIGYIKIMTKFNIFQDNEIKYLMFGAGSFDFRVKAMYKKPFAKLNKYEKDRFFKFYINRDRRNYKWVKNIKIHTLYALMSDPIYGGNKDMSGWKWLGVKTPNPRPKTRMGR